MAKRKTSTGSDRAPGAPALTNAEVNDRLVALADTLGTMAGRLHGRAEGLVDSRKLSRQLTAVRDQASRLLQQLAKAAPGRQTTKAAPAPRAATKGRSGGTVDAPGKKHRKPMPADPRAMTMQTRAARARAGRPAVPAAVPPRRG